MKGFTGYNKSMANQLLRDDGGQRFLHYVNLIELVQI